MTPLVEVRDLAKHFPVRRGLVLPREIGRVRAVDGVSFTLARGETLAIVGESGCGKSTLGRLLLRLIEPTGGTVRFDGIALTALDRRALRATRRRMQMIFQDPFASLNPRLSVRALLAEPLRLHLRLGAAEIARRVAELLALVGLSAWHAERYPHEFSGGQRQRIGIARALATQPELIVCDEPVSALDVSIQAHVINLLDDLKQRFALSYIFISHDLAVVHHIADRVAVMYLGEIVEIGDKRAVIGAPKHPYTQTLLAAVPRPDVTAARAREIPRGDVPSPLHPPSGCRFHARCSHATARCREERPMLAALPDGRAVACHLVSEIPQWSLGASGGASSVVRRRLAIIAAARAQRSQ
ncbi:MAG TPA: dipeptide ABC transporter ATP-binding protein [Xanthobacteraceae bacterium]|nr:dipeptide ABC transporter ATP-binding protein [Xanthobacteraceae bacterium]